MAYLQRRDSQYETREILKRLNAVIATGTAADIKQAIDQALANPSLPADLRKSMEDRRSQLK